MDVLVAGAHGAVGQHVTRLLAEHDDHAAHGMVRTPSYDDDIAALGATPVRGDVTARDSLDAALEESGADALVFAAGSSGADVWGVDRDGARNCVDACADADVERFVMLSAMNAEAPGESPAELREYLRAKAEADAYLRESELTATIARPGALTDEPGTGHVRVGADLDRSAASVPREDVAATLVAALPMVSTYGVTFELLSGETPIERALRSPLAD
ncbi:nucleoside-diphosphate-sugar epimerase [Halarchaeum rubridurum]|uniref:NAD dependent epimerase/dehydratase n=1 Tax=Halarchaeum rubridurum TaxID=489911 RepID=A0A830FQU9_9EURY|nr:SDR family oxidoreductase [Halarchaeum rubridurum]MBP1954571.1 nucleoside-diphosphate-sugar epimerase [Halarchaeum rubridurum]GGM62126.1 NAD dependent epimerase/dehydratase [Halarchaeum rubridurum]